VSGSELFVSYNASAVKYTTAPEAGSLKILGQSELRHNSKDDLFTICEKIVMELWLSYDWPKIFKEPAPVA
jgi:hypothetical protein